MLISKGPGGLGAIEEADEQIEPAVQAFLGFLERDMVANPQRLRPFGSETTQRAAELVDGVDIDLDAPLDNGLRGLGA